MQISLFSRTFMPLRTKYSPQHPVPSVCFLPLTWQTKYFRHHQCHVTCHLSSDTLPSKLHLWTQELFTWQIFWSRYTCSACGYVRMLWVRLEWTLFFKRLLPFWFLWSLVTGGFVWWMDDSVRWLSSVRYGISLTFRCCLNILRELGVNFTGDCLKDALTTNTPSHYNKTC